VRQLSKTMFLRENLLPEEKRYLIDYLNSNYDYCYLSAMHNIQVIEKPEVIITGSSHGLDAINAYRLPSRAVNLSMHTQDLYYDYLNILKAVSQNENIRVCVVTVGYYSLHYDLSRTSYNYRCYEVYKPLFNDIHNAKADYVGKCFKNPSESEKDFYTSYFAQYNHYYGPAVLRDHTNGEIRKHGGWCNLSAIEREQYAQNRADKHNKHIKYIDTYKENSGTLLKIAELCHEKNIRLLVAVMPFTQEYMRHIYAGYKDILIEQLERIPYGVEFIDFNEADCFCTEDFVDSDHVSDSGAEKVTEILKDYV